MKIRLKTLMAGPHGVFQPGSAIDPPREEAEALISVGYAERLENPPETAAVEPGIRAVRPMSRTRKAQLRTSGTRGTRRCWGIQL